MPRLPTPHRDTAPANAAKLDDCGAGRWRNLYLQNRGSEMTLKQTAQQAIEMIATEDLSKWASRHDKVVIDALKAAIHAEQAQAVEPVAWITTHDCPLLCITEAEADTFCDSGERSIPLYTHPAPPPATGDRAELIAELKSACIDGTLHATLVNKAADMLEADVQQQRQLTEAVDANARLLIKLEAIKRAQQVAVPDGLIDALREASEFISAVHYGAVPQTRYPLPDELDGFAAILTAQGEKP